jgi:Acetyltransferase (GNAT) domain
LSVREDDRRQAEVGFTFPRIYQGKGLAGEAATAVLDYAFKSMELRRVIAITDGESERSIALLERLGMRREGHFVENIWFKGRWGSEYLYAVLREKWLGRRALYTDFGPKRNSVCPFGAPLTRIVISCSPPASPTCEIKCNSMSVPFSTVAPLTVRRL